MKTIVVASTNEGKIREFRQMLEPRGYEVKCLKDFSDYKEVEENGTTFEENAVIKAQAFTDQFGVMAIADDSGLMIDAFGGKPGVHSARWLGHDTSYDVKNAKVLELMKNEKNRKCRYVCAIAITDVNQKPIVFADSVECEIADHPAGHNGFGYDPIVYYPPFHKTMAEMSKEEKNSISHRGKAIRKLEDWLEHAA